MGETPVPAPRARSEADRVWEEFIRRAPESIDPREGIGAFRAMVIAFVIAVAFIMALMVGVVSFEKKGATPNRSGVERGGG